MKLGENVGWVVFLIRKVEAKSAQELTDLRWKRDMLELKTGQNSGNFCEMQSPMKNAINNSKSHGQMQ